MHRNIICVICAALTIGCAAEFNPDLGGLDGTETSGTTTDVGTADTGSETDTGDSATGETDTGSTDETGSTGDGDGDTGTETETGDGDGDPGPGDSCDPFGALCPADHTCTFGKSEDMDFYWYFFCEEIENPPVAQIGDICNSGLGTTTCFNSYCAADGLVNVEDYCGGMPGTLDGCCVPLCHSDGQNGITDCPVEDFGQCVQLGNTENTEGFGWCFDGG